MFEIPGRVKEVTSQVLGSDNAHAEGKGQRRSTAHIETYWKVFVSKAAVAVCLLLRGFVEGWVSHSGGALREFSGFLCANYVSCEEVPGQRKAYVLRQHAGTQCDPRKAPKHSPHSLSLVLDVLLRLWATSLLLCLWTHLICVLSRKNTKYSRLCWNFNSNKILNQLNKKRRTQKDN